MSVERLYTPWRMKYINGKSDKKSGCVFCNNLHANPADDRENFVIYRGEHTFTVMNIYPYNCGHLMVLPREHLSTLSQVSEVGQVEMMTMTSYLTDILTELMNPDGFNIGVNIGKAAGAGIDSHLHLHIVPRWNGDSNFMPVVGETRLLPEELPTTYDKIVAAINSNPR